MSSLERALIFDVDGVLVEPWGFAGVLERLHGISRTTTRHFFAGPFNLCLIGEALLEELLPQYLRQWGWSASTEDFVALWLESDDKPVSDAFKVIEDTRSPSDICCVASNQERTRAAYIAHEMGFASRFDRLYFSCDVGALKPQAAFYRNIQIDLQIPAERIYFWDDSQQHVEAAAALGWNAYLYDGPESISRPFLR